MIDEILEGMRLRDEGMQRALSAVDDEWKISAYDAFIQYARDHRGTSFMTEDVRAWAEKSELVSPVKNKRVWGPIAAKAARRGFVAKVDTLPCKTATGHAGPRAVWVMP
jgi:histidine ammonia-lyase